jgi:tetratricopeptide (TPR) repeat protein
MPLMMKSTNKFILLILGIVACGSPQSQEVNQDVMRSMGESVKNTFLQTAERHAQTVADDPNNVYALTGLAETKVLLYIFGYMPREETLPMVRETFQKLVQIDSSGSNTLKLSGILNFLDWKWIAAKTDFLKAIEADPENLNARHWYSLYLSALGRFQEAMAQSDTIGTMDPEGTYAIGRGSLFYFARRNVELKELMIQAVAKDTSVAWGYDWLGMAYIELKDYENSLETYYRAFELSDGTVEVGAGLGHALGLAGKYEAAKQMADYYAVAAKNHYLPPVQRAFIHIGIGEYDEAIRLLEQAYAEKSWFLIFMQVEPWLDPVRKDPRFEDIIRRMEFPE